MDSMYNFFADWGLYFMAWGAVSLVLGYMGGYNAAARKANNVVWGAYAFLNEAERAAFKRALKRSRVALGEENASEKGGEGE